MDLDQALSYYERAEAHGHAKAAELRGRMLDSSLWKEHLELKERYPEKPIEVPPGVCKHLDEPLFGPLGERPSQSQTFCLASSRSEHK